MKTLIRCILLAAMLVTKSAMAAEQNPKALTVFAASSLTDSLQKIGDAYTKSAGMPIKLSFAASSALARQIEAGARADIFFAADQEWMDYLQNKQLIDKSSRTELLGNRLVLVAPRESTTAFKLKPGAALLAALGPNGRLATGDPDSVPVGKYAKKALTSLNLWKTVEPRLARAENVRVALSYVARGEAPLGIVYATDAAVEPGVRVIDTFAEASHGPITYPVAATISASPDAARFLAFLQGPQASKVFADAGFKTLIPESQPPCIRLGSSFDLTEELKLFQTASTQILAAGSLQSAAMLQPGKLYRTSLKSQSEVRFTAPVGKATIADGSYAGIFRIAAGSARTLRVTVNTAAWIDVVEGNRALESARYAGLHDCPLLRKSVEFEVPPNEALLLQISGSTEQDVMLAVTRN
jgi:molybdate transport system substrate-binding protein